MPKSTAVAPIEPVALPALNNAPTYDIGIDDIPLPRLYMGQPGGDAVQEGRVPAHCLWLGLSADDPEPNVLYEQGNGDGVLIHVLDMFTGMSANLDSDGNVVKSGGDLRSWNRRNSAGQYVDDNGEPAPKGAYKTFNFTVCLPEVDAEVPVKFMLKSTSTKAAQKINYVLMKNARQGPGHALAFRITTEPHKKETFRWTQAVVKQVDAEQANIQAADDLLSMLNQRDAMNDAPAGGTDLDEPSI